MIYWVKRIHRGSNETKQKKCGSICINPKTSHSVNGVSVKPKIETIDFDISLNPLVLDMVMYVFIPRIFRVSCLCSADEKSKCHWNKFQFCNGNFGGEIFINSRELT